jgi:SAM-dependent methyltransferase
MQEYPGLQYRRVQPGEGLPFADREFDIVFSNAVVEHTGSRASQAAFVREICRVGKQFFITTPNRWFPVEHHTGLPLLHYLPASWFRAALRPTKYAYWAEEQNLNILTMREFRGLFPAGCEVDTHVVRLAGIGANLIAIGQHRDA